MSEQDKRACQAVWPPHGDGLCGRPAVWEYKTVSGAVALLCERCVYARVIPNPGMRARLTRLDAEEVGS